jgi:hypothetical protein
VRARALDVYAASSSRAGWLTNMLCLLQHRIKVANPPVF